MRDLLVVDESWDAAIYAAKAWDAARSADLTSHPDTERPKCFGRNQCPEYGDYQKCRFSVECDNIICAARAQEGGAM
jgi:hypothetical protein